MATKHISRQNSINCEKTDLSPHLSFGEISSHDRFVFIFFHMTNFSLYLPSRDIFPTDNLSHGELLHMTICHVEKFLHMTDFSPQVLHVVPVTNIRYEGESVFRM